MCVCVLFSGVGNSPMGGKVKRGADPYRGWNSPPEDILNRVPDRSSTCRLRYQQSPVEVKLKKN